MGPLAETFRREQPESPDVVTLDEVATSVGWKSVSNRSDTWRGAERLGFWARLTATVQDGRHGAALREARPARPITDPWHT